MRLPALGALLVAGAALHAQPYPAKSILVISPVQAGSAGDTTLRLVTQQMSRNMGQQLQVENIVGAAGLIGAQRLARAAPDGYTLGGVSDSTVTYVPILQKRSDFDALAAFESISMVSASTWVLIAHPSLPAKRVPDLVALAKAQPRRLDYASAGLGGSHHVVMEMFKAATGIPLNHVPYRGAAQAAVDVQAGHVPVMFSALAVVLGPIHAGRLRALGIANEKRSPLLPDVPTIAESGVPGFQFATWTGLFGPRGTPKPIVDRLNAEVVKVVNDSTVRAKLQALGGNPQSTTPAELADLIRRTTARMLKVIQDAKISVE
ncbi:MAG TPA: tripartite tricarboxylate transporter substrate binding protein [Burkholderiales bacterium]|nr:tripartite tricarboxylate transporter substrate binding protein [Burkholderiales bacterium]